MRISKAIMLCSITLLSLSANSYSNEASFTTVICTLEGSAQDVYSGSKHGIKVQTMIKFDSSGVIDFDNQFLEGGDGSSAVGMESSIWSNGFNMSALSINDAVTESYITISLVNSGFIPTASNVMVQQANWDIVINRKSGIAKIDAIYHISMTLPSDNNKKRIILATYSAFGDCSKAENKF
jgi:hypothetical protein